MCSDSASKGRTFGVVFHTPTTCSRLKSLGVRATSVSSHPVSSPPRVILGESFDISVYKASLETENDTYRHGLIVKMTFTKEQKPRLNNEINVYTHSYKNGVVDCIADALGVFHASDDNLEVLILRSAGKSLTERKDMDLPRYFTNPFTTPFADEMNVSLTEKQRLGFLDALDKIHKAGVLLGSDNISDSHCILNKDNHARIVGFSEARIVAVASTKGQKRSCHNRVLKDRRLERAQPSEIVRKY